MKLKDYLSNVVEDAIDIQHADPSTGKAITALNFSINYGKDVKKTNIKFSIGIGNFKGVFTTKPARGTAELRFTQAVIDLINKFFEKQMQVGIKLDFSKLLNKTIEVKNDIVELQIDHNDVVFYKPKKR